MTITGGRKAVWLVENVDPKGGGEEGLNNKKGNQLEEGFYPKKKNVHRKRYERKRLAHHRRGEYYRAKSAAISLNNTTQEKKGGGCTRWRRDILKGGRGGLERLWKVPRKLCGAPRQAAVWERKGDMPEYNWGLGKETVSEKA